MCKAELKACGALLCAALTSLIAGCSSGPEKLLNGAWDCKIGDDHTVFRIEVTDRAVKISEREGIIEARIVKVDGKDLYLASPAEKDQGIIRFADDNSFTLQDVARMERPAWACKRKK